MASFDDQKAITEYGCLAAPDPDGLRQMNSRDHTSVYLGIEVLQVDEKEVEAVLYAGSESMNGYGLVHGGALMMLCDIVAGHHMEALGFSAVTLNSSFHFLKGARPGLVYARSHIEKKGRSIVLLTVQVEQEGVLYLTGQISFFLLEPVKKMVCARMKPVPERLTPVDMRAYDKKGEGRHLGFMQLPDRDGHRPLHTLDQVAYSWGMEMVYADDTEAEGVLYAGIEAINGYRTVHGGHLMMLCDTVTGHHLVAMGYSGVTLHTSLQFLTAIKGGVVRCVSRVQKVGRTVAVLSVAVYSGEKLCLTGQVSYYVTGQTKRYAFPRLAPELGRL